jgi:carbamate kinase
MMAPVNSTDPPGKPPQQRILIALGGNALCHPDGSGYLDQTALATIAQQVVTIAQSGVLPIITFGNGPQVGQCLTHLVQDGQVLVPVANHPFALHTAVSWTQGEMAAALISALQSAWQTLLPDSPMPAMAHVQTRVVVDESSPEALTPVKPVGPPLLLFDAQTMSQRSGLTMAEVSPGRYRLLVPSPPPKQVLELNAIRALVDQGAWVICAGGGGLPYRQTSQGLVPINAVVDKDRTSAMLAAALSADGMVIGTLIDRVYIHFGSPQVTPLCNTPAEDVKRYAALGHFGAGSMGPKIEAALAYLDQPTQAASGQVWIANIQQLSAAMAGETGTRIYNPTP